MAGLVDLQPLLDLSSASERNAPRMNKILCVFGVLLVLLAILYFSVPANEFAPWFPGYDPELTRVRFKHGILSLVVGAGLFGYAWYRSRGRSA